MGAKHIFGVLRNKKTGGLYYEIVQKSSRRSAGGSNGRFHDDRLRPVAQAAMVAMAGIMAASPARLRAARKNPASLRAVRKNPISLRVARKNPTSQAIL